MAAEQQKREQWDQLLEKAEAGDSKPLRTHITERRLQRTRGEPAGVESFYVDFTWPTCAQSNCVGVQLPSSNYCFGHAADADQDAFGSALYRLHNTGELDLRGVRLDSAFLAELLKAASRGADGKAQLMNAQFDGAVFDCDADFSQVVLRKRSSFNGVHFRSLAAFSLFAGDVWFQDTTFGDYAGFDGCVFEDGVRLDAATFVKGAHLGATFKGDVYCPGVIFLDYVQILGATFEAACNLGEILAVQGIRIHDTTFADEATLWINSPWVSFDGSRFAGRTTIMLNGGDVTLRGADFRALSSISDRSDEPPSAQAAALGLQTLHRARLLEVIGTNLSELTLEDIDVADCRFVGGGGLDRLHLEGEARFPIKGSRWDWRRVIADERAWRAAHGFRNWPRPAWTEVLELSSEPAVPSAEQIAETYRALRKGREDIKDEPGSADFYYGEMEMRRLSGKGSPEKARGLVERAILTVYWLTSGYALRAGRAFVSLLLTVALFGVLLKYFGFDPRPSLAETLLYSAKSTSSLFRPPDEISGYSITYAGELLQLALRLLGPLFFGLILLSIRGRVKR